VNKHSNKPRIVVSLLLAPALATPCFGFAEIARGALLLDTTGSVMYESYFLGSIDNDPDVLYSLYPSLRYTRRAGRASITANAGVAFNRYDKNTQYDSDDIRAGASIDLPTAEGSRLNGNFSINYNETTDVDLVVNDRVASETFSTSLLLDYKLSTRMNLRDTLGYTSSTRSAYSDQDVLSNQLSFTYEDFLRGTNLTLGHGLNIVKSSGENETGIALDQQSHDISLALSRPLYGDVIGSLGYGYTFINRSAAESINGDRNYSSSYVSVGLEGPFLPARRFPKLESSASLSYRQANVSGIGDTNGKFLSGNLRLSWAARETTRLSFDASRSIDLTITDRTTENTRVGGGFNQQLGRTTALTGSAGYTWSDTRGIDSSYSALDASLGLSRSFNKYLSAALNYTYTENQSGDNGTVQLGRFARSDYERHTLMASATVTF
jgi:hypothetical protein